MPGLKTRKPDGPAPRRRRPAAAPQPEGSGEGSLSALARMLEQEKLRGRTRPPREEPDDDELLSRPPI